MEWSSAAWQDGLQSKDIFRPLEVLVDLCLGDLLRDPAAVALCALNTLSAAAFGTGTDLLGVVVVVVKLLVDWFFSTQIGLSLRATGANPRMARAQGVATGAATLAGMALSNALVALAGALYAQTQGGADVSMGIGTIVIGLAAVIIGETVLPARRLVLTTLAVVVGAILYRFFIALALNSDFIGLQAQDLNMVTAALVVIALVLPGVRRKVFGKFAKTTTKGN